MEDLSQKTWNVQSNGGMFAADNKMLVQEEDAVGGLAAILKWECPYSGEVDLGLLPWAISLSYSVCLIRLSLTCIILCGETKKTEISMQVCDNILEKVLCLKTPMGCI